MSTLRVLKIQGIRSVGDEAHIIKFLHPLTIIQGPNGTGKTTTIEALNYVTTGTLPAGKMQSFIHNNKLSKKKKVDALVQLEFEDVKGNLCTATKRMTAAMTAGKTEKVTTKSDEFTLARREPNGDVKSVSAKVADFNREMMLSFGVPSAVLQHVIFCHQEESNWPLSEPKELKQRFDAIFEVTKYVKAVEALKKNVKELEGDLRSIITELPYLVQQRDQRAALCVARDETQEKIKDVDEVISQFCEEKMEHEKELQQIRGRLKDVTERERKAEMLNKEIQMIRETVHSLNVEPYQGSQKELESQLGALEGSQKFLEAEQKRANAKQRQTELNQLLQTINIQSNKVQGRINQSVASRMMLESCEKEYNDMVAEGQEKLGIAGEGAVFVACVESHLNEVEADIKTFENLAKIDRERAVCALRDAEKLARDAEFNEKYKTREKNELQASVNKVGEDLAALQKRIEKFASDKGHLTTRLGKITTRERPSLALLTTQLQALQNESAVLTEFSSNNVDIDRLMDDMDGLSLDAEHAFEKLSVRFLAKRRRQRSKAVDNLVDSQSGCLELQAVEMEVNELTDKLAKLEGTKALTEDWLPAMRSTNHCPLCDQSCTSQIAEQAEKNFNVTSIEEQMKSVKRALSEAKKKEMNAVFAKRVECVSSEIEVIEGKIAQEQTWSKQESDLKRQIENLDRGLLNANVMMGQLQQDLNKKSGSLTAVVEELASNEGQASSLESDLKNRKSELDELEKRLGYRRRELTERRSALQHVLDGIKRGQHKISEARVRVVDVSELEAEKDRLSLKMEDARSELNNLTVFLTNCDQAEGQVRLMKDQLRLFAARERIQEKQAELRDLGLEGCPSSQQLSQSDQRLNRRVLELNNNILRRQGQREEMQRKLKEVSTQLKSEAMQTVRDRLKNKVIEKSVMTAAIEDLSKYGKVLDDSIIAFHRQKMEQINMILKELWPRVYQGNDIEFIMVKSQPASSTDKKKSYDYSVVMVVDQQEIEMRDRCSAGQKVLASILIRIALADVFGSNCPILALDEPTTNLDASKVENIGAMLRELLEVCNHTPDKHNAPFRKHLQLIVITHDRRLVDHLYLACRPELLYILSKDETGTSHITTKTALNDGCFAY